MKLSSRLNDSFFQQDVLIVAPALIGCKLIRKIKNNLITYTITETEAYKGEDDLACHASKGRTKRTEIMYNAGGCYYIYLIYGMYWMLNIVTGNINQPQAVLVRGINNYNGPGKLTKALNIDKSFNGQNIFSNTEMWIEKRESIPQIYTEKRIGIDYAGDIWKNKEWRFFSK